MTTSSLSVSSQAQPVLAGGESPPAIDSGLICLVMMARYHGIAADPDQLAHEFAVAGYGMTVEQILLASKHLQLKAKLVRANLSRLDKLPLPVIAVIKSKQNTSRFIIVAGFDGDRVLIQDPVFGRPQTIEMQQFQAWGVEQLLLFTSRAGLAGDMRKFDFSWFIPALRYC
jgi:subfamily B ATP-binding cassette protein HlyB/CyaB